MRTKPKPTLTSNSHNKSLKSSSFLAVKSESESTISTQRVRMPSKRLLTNQKQNMETENKLSPGLKFKDKTFRPKLRKLSNLELSSTVSLIINQSECTGKKNDLLESLLYGEVDLTYSQDFHRKEEESDQLLIDTCDETINFKTCKILSPIKSISEYSLTEAQHHVFLLQKVEHKISNVLLKAKVKSQAPQVQQVFDHCVLLRRLGANFTEKNENIIKFYCAVHRAVSKEDLLMKIREFLFVNAIIFNRNELHEMVNYLDNKICQINRTSGNYSYSEESIQLTIEEAFFSVDSKNSLITEAFWLEEDILDKLFYEKDIISVWKLILTLCVEISTQVEASFRQSRFCLSRDSTQFVHETDEKRKQEITSKLQKWLSAYLKQFKCLSFKPTLIK